MDEPQLMNTGDWFGTATGRVVYALSPDVAQGLGRYGVGRSLTARLRRGTAGVARPCVDGSTGQRSADCAWPRADWRARPGTAGEARNGRARNAARGRGRLGLARLGSAASGTAGVERRRTSTQGLVRQARRGWATIDKAWPGQAGLEGQARLRTTRHGTAGGAWLGCDRRGLARQA